MTCRAMTILLALMGGAAATATAQGQIVSAQVDTSNTIYAGWNFSYYIIISGANQPGQVDLTPLKRFNPRATGTQSLNQNGAQRFVMMYALTANAAGAITVPPVPVTVNGQTYQTNPVTVTAVEPRTTDRLDLEVSLSDQRCYVGQPITMTLRFYVDANAGAGDLRFNVPPLTSDDFAIEEPSAINPQATSYRLASGVEVRVTQRVVPHAGKQMTLVSFSKLLIPTHSGRIELQGSSVLIELATGRVRTNDIWNPIQNRYELFGVHSDPLVLNVLPLPTANKPADYYGLVGRYTISASATPTQVNVGDPITLTIRIGGNSFLKAVRWPDLESVPELARSFKIPAEKASPVIENDEKVFTQTIRASNADVTEIPPIPLAYFDPDSGAYVVTRTKAIPLEVAPTRVLTTSDIEGTTAGPVGRDVQAVREGFSANYGGYDLLANQQFSPLRAAFSPAYMAMWLLPLLALVGSSVFRLATRTSPEAVARKRKRQACARALQQLREAGSADADRHDLVVSALKTYLGQRLDRVAGSLTADDCRDLVIASTDNAELADRFRAKVSQLEAARYAPLDTHVDAAQVEEAIDLIRQVEKELKR